MKDVCIAYADKSGNGFSVSEPWIKTILTRWKIASRKPMT